MYICDMLIPLNPDATQQAFYCVLGFVIVMCVLLMQSLLTSFIGKIFSVVEKLRNSQ